MRSRTFLRTRRLAIQRSPSTIGTIRSIRRQGPRTRRPGDDNAVVEEYPDITIFAYRLLCDLLPALASDADPTPALQTSAFGLVPGFVNGWLDVAPPTVKII